MGVSAFGVSALPVAGEDGLSSIADKGLGGPIVPKRIEARCFALPPPGLSSSSSEESSLSEPVADHSSASGRARDLGPVGTESRGLAASC
jgi:hypothetical protein